MAEDDWRKLVKVCSKCGVEKPVPEFYLRRKTGRRVAACRSCCRAASRAWHRRKREADPEGYRAYRHQLYEQEDGEKRRRRFRRFYHRDRRRAARRNRWGYLRAKGLLDLAERCADCDRPAEDVHHWVEEGVLHLVSLCHRCHMQRHFAVWRREGGGPLRRHWELLWEEDELREEEKKKEEEQQKKKSFGGGEPS